ncbi:SDR family NAD(P)-dependent oxidoreductase [Nocardia sp. NPDC051832]|uniref:SDR family NAD(P)-dependent oxidoreductase n=1 Tax=Nocardia sp. NPDC051832 TaxID=3155673 RepID=UPI00342C4560
MATIAGAAILITGANRGIGKALLEEALRRGAAHVYACTRDLFEHEDERVTALLMDVTDSEGIEQAAKGVPALDILVNNAGVAAYDDLADPAVVEYHLAVNLFGVHCVTQVFLPLLERSRGAIVNNVSVAALAPLPIIPSYSISKAAAHSLTQSQRTLFAGRGVCVHAVFTGPTDTEMSRDFDAPKASAASVASAIFDGVETGQEDIFPDAMSRTMAAGWASGPAKALEREYAAIPTVERPAAPRL